jgi:hypothetical protein
MQSNVGICTAEGFLGQPNVAGTILDQQNFDTSAHAVQTLLIEIEDGREAAPPQDSDANSTVKCLMQVLLGREHLEISQSPARLGRAGDEKTLRAKPKKIKISSVST